MTQNATSAPLFVRAQLLPLSAVARGARILSEHAKSMSGKIRMFFNGFFAYLHVFLATRKNDEK